MKREALTGAEVSGATAVCWLAAIELVAYLVDRIGLTISPPVVLAASIVAAAAMCAWLLREAVWHRADTITFFAVVGAILGWLLWLAWPELLPLGGGGDLAHHLQLIEYIDRHWRLVHDPALESSLGEMTYYTPGAHLLAALAGRWSGSDGFHAIYSIVAVSAAIKVGFVFLIAKRITSTAFAIVAVALVFMPSLFSVGSFTRDSYIAQVVSEMFAVAMWWTLTLWFAAPSKQMLAVFGLAGVGTILTWPVWAGPPLLVLGILAWSRTDLSVREKTAALLLAGLPIFIIAAIHAAGRLQWANIVRTDADMPLPAWSSFTPWFIAVAAAGVIATAMSRSARVTALFLLACGLQVIALFVAARTNRARVPYMAIKMIYLVIYPLAVAGAFAAMLAWRRVTGAPAVSRFSDRAAWAFAIALAVAMGWRTIRTPLPKPIVSDSLYRAGHWARVHLDPACVDYITANDNTAYWLHLSVLGNRRLSERTADEATFNTRDAIIRWIEQDGLPYAIADLGTIPRDVLEGTDEIARFGTAVVIRRKGAARCAQ